MAPFSSVSNLVPLPDFDVVGFDAYISASLGASFPVYLGVFMTESTYSGGLKEYGDDIEAMKRDILSGDGSPALLVPHLAREFAAQLAEEYFD